LLDIAPVVRIVTFCLVAVALGSQSTAQVRQNPSPMVETTRSHPRLERATPEGSRFDLETGNLFIPQELVGSTELPLFVHFHGGNWLPEVAAARNGRRAVISVQLGAGSGVYRRKFANAAVFPRLIEQAEAKSGIHFSQVGLTAWSAGYGAIREILKTQENYRRVQFVVLIDGLHAGYLNGEPGPLESQLVPADLEVFVKLAQDALFGNKQMIVTHSEIFPGTFASTTETADYLLKELAMPRTAVLKWGPMGTQQLSEARSGRFLVRGYAGNAAPDHVDQLHSLPDYLRLIE
jgi:hypothetical protein